MYRALLFLLLFISKVGLHGQSFFNILPDVGGIDGQAMCFIVVPDTNSIKIIGHRYDTILPGPNTKPWLGHFNYDGELFEIIPLIDSHYVSPFNVFNIPLAGKINDIYYYYTRRDVGGQYFTSNLIELDVANGEIYKSKLITNDDFPDLAYPGIFIDYNKPNHTILLLNSLYKDDSVKTYITILDTLFKIEKIIEIKESHRANYAHYGKMNTDGTFTVLGFALIEHVGQPDYYNFYLNIIDSSGFILDHKLAPTIVPLTLGLAHTRTIVQDNFGNWIISGLHYEDRSDSCMDCYQLIPYIFSATQDFDSLLWQTRFFDVPDMNFPQYVIHSMAQLQDGYVVAGDYQSGASFPESGVLFKASNAGDSLWMKHYIPLSWEDDRVAWASLNDVKATPYGTIIAVGAINDKVSRKIRPWVLHLDSDGCLVPGCNTVSTNEENITASNKDYFKIYPNPVSKELYLLSTITSNDPVNISVVSNDGIVLKMRDFNPLKGYQYLLPVSDLASGIYHLILTNPKTNQTESHTFIRQ